MAHLSPQWAKPTTGRSEGAQVQAPYSKLNKMQHLRQQESMADRTWP